jgi:hypothetical protein
MHPSRERRLAQPVDSSADPKPEWRYAAPWITIRKSQAGQKSPMRSRAAQTAQHLPG